jgi:hypothetical protein
MRRYRSLAAGLTLLGVLGVSIVSAQNQNQNRNPNQDKERGQARRPLDPDVIAVRILLGVGDRQVLAWDGRIRLDQGEILDVEGYRFRQGDELTGRDSWKARSHIIRKVAAKKKAAAAAGAPTITPSGKATGPSTTGPTVTPNGVIVSLKAPAEATLTLALDQGEVKIPIADLADGSARTYLDDKVEARRVPVSVPIVEGPAQEDFPAASADAQGGTWIAYVVHKPFGAEDLESYTERPKNFDDLAPKGGGDQIRLLRFDDGKAGAPIDVTTEGRDVWRPAVAVSGDGAVVVAWSENVENNWDLYQRTYDPGERSWSEPKRLTRGPGADTDVVLATAPDGKVWMAWQGWNEGQADILLAPIDRPDAPLRISEGLANEWAPAIAIDKQGRVHVAYDSYAAGNYDVMLRTLGRDGTLGPALAVARTPKFEVRPSLAIDPNGRAWVAYEERTEDWGKDAENLLQGEGSTLYRRSAVRVRCVDGDRLLEAPDPVATAPESVASLNSYPRLLCDRSGRLWLAFRHRQESVWGNQSVMVVGGVWVEYVTTLLGKEWSVPQVLTRSDGLLDNRPALLAPSDGPPLIVYSTDGRLRREVEMNPKLNLRYYSHAGTPPGVYNNDVEVAALSTTRRASDPVLSAPDPREDRPEGPPVHPDEAADVGRMRDYRVQAAGKTYRLLRGDFHRHTEISMDGGSDGSLEDMWRYGIDAARFDWMGDEDHDNGGGKEYTWWLVQKTTDLYLSPMFTPMFTYERSVAYPNGHRNVMFARRGVRTLPRLVGESGVIDDDTKMLYDYLKAFDGICASHTSATGMGTDWRDVNAQYEPFVEIYQGHRNSYEHYGAPRVARSPNESIGGWRPLGMVWNALSLQYKFGFQASSDHISTHISYAIAIAEDHSRAAILDAFRKRHCYGATDNILLDVRSGEHIMGDEFDADGPVRLKVLVHGTRPIARVDVIKDFVYVFSTEPKGPRVEFQWTDEETRPPGTSWYYVRAVQDDGEIAWGSPLWVNTRGVAAGR